MRDTILPVENETYPLEDYQDMAGELVQKQLANEEIRSRLAGLIPNLIKQIQITGNNKFEVQFVAGGIKSNML